MRKVLIPLASLGVLVTCILAAWFLAHLPSMKRMEDDLARGAQLPPHDILIHVDADDTVYVDGRPVKGVADIPDMISGNPRGKDVVILVRINAQAPLGRHAQISGTLALAGYGHIRAQRYLGDEVDEVVELEAPQWLGVGSGPGGETGDEEGKEQG